MRRLSLLVLFLFAPSIGFSQSRSASAGSSSGSSSSAGSSHSSGASGGSSSHSGGGSSGSSHSGAGSSHSTSGGSNAHSSAGGANHGSHPGNSSSSHSVSHSDRGGANAARNSRLGSENVKSKPPQAIPAKVNPQKPTTKPHNWLARLFHRRRPEIAQAPRPCTGKNCPPPAPKPCKGQKCPPPPACGPGTVSNGQGGCTATNRAGNEVCTTNPQAPGCPTAQVQNQYSNCAALRAQLQQAIMEQDRLRQSMNTACAAGSQSTECNSLSQRYNARALEVESLRQRLMACR